MFGNYNPYASNPYAVQYQPQGQQPNMQGQQMQQPMQGGNSGIIWVQGEAGAKSYLVAPNNSLLLMDSEGDYFYIKSTDNTGMPKLRKYQYAEVIENASPSAKEIHSNGTNVDMSNYITREEFAAELAKISGIKNDNKRANKKESAE